MCRHIVSDASRGRWPPVWTNARTQGGRARILDNTLAGRTARDMRGYTLGSCRILRERDVHDD